MTFRHFLDIYRFRPTPNAKCSNDCLRSTNRVPKPRRRRKQRRQPPKGAAGEEQKRRRAMGRGICFKAYVSGTPTGLKMGVEALNPPVVDTRQPGATRQNA